MTLSLDLAALDLWLGQLPHVAKTALGDDGQQMYTLDFIMVGAVKRTMSLGAGLKFMVDSQNMVCSRALLRMQLDTLSRLRAYTYVIDPETLARNIVAGAQMNHQKSSDGKSLNDKYLIDRLSQEHPWVSKTYKATSGYIHFSESQFFDTLQSVGTKEEATINLTVSAKDEKFPKESWVEVVSCFNELTRLLVETIDAYAQHKKVV